MAFLYFFPETKAHNCDDMMKTLDYTKDYILSEDQESWCAIPLKFYIYIVLMSYLSFFFVKRIILNRNKQNKLKKKSQMTHVSAVRTKKHDM